MESEDKRRITESLTRRAGESPSAPQVAAATVSTLQAMDAALTPIIGQRGVAALYWRSLFLCTPGCDGLTAGLENVHSVMELAPLEQFLAGQHSADTFTASVTLLTTFNELLATLVGPSLTERLLRSVWEHSFSGTAPQDISP